MLAGRCCEGYSKKNKKGDSPTKSSDKKTKEKEKKKSKKQKKSKKAAMDDSDPDDTFEQVRTDRTTNMYAGASVDDDELDSLPMSPSASGRLLTEAVSILN